MRGHQVRLLHLDETFLSYRKDLRHSEAQFFQDGLKTRSVGNHS